MSAERRVKHQRQKSDQRHHGRRAHDRVRMTAQPRCDV
jgi:hypothetical protein